LHAYLRSGLPDGPLCAGAGARGRPEERGAARRWRTELDADLFARARLLLLLAPALLDAALEPQVILLPLGLPRDRRPMQSGPEPRLALIPR